MLNNLLKLSINIRNLIGDFLIRIVRTSIKKTDFQKEKENNCQECDNSVCSKKSIEYYKKCQE